MHIALHSSPHSLNKLKFFLTRLLIQIHWLFKARFRSIHTLHGCTVFPAMVLWKYNWSWSGNAPALRQHYAWREPWPCCVQLVRKSAQKIASEPLPFYPCEVTLTSNSSSPFASVGLFELSFTLMTLGSSCGGGHQAHFTGRCQAATVNRGCFLRDTNDVCPIPPCKV